MKDGYHGIQLLGHGLERGRATNQLGIGSGALLSPLEDSSGIMDARILPAIGAGRHARRDLDRWERSVRGRRLHVPKLGEQAVEGAVAPMRIVARRVIRSNMDFTIATSLGKLRRITACDSRDARLFGWRSR